MSEAGGGGCGLLGCRLEALSGDPCGRHSAPWRSSPRSAQGLGGREGGGNDHMDAGVAAKFTWRETDSCPETHELLT